MHTEKQQWYCNICEKKYSLKRKDNHRLTKVHKNNKERRYRNAIYEEYTKRRDELLMNDEDVGDMDFLGFLKKRRLEDKQLEKIFGRNYKYEYKYTHYDTDSDSDSDDEDTDSDDEDTDSDDEDADYKDEIHKK